MRKIFPFFFVCFLALSGLAQASTIYLPTDTSSQYLPTVKIFAYTLSYDGSLISEGYGSGTLIDSSGTILTNNHVIEDYWDPALTYDAFQVCLTKSDDPETPICEFTASFIARDPDRDLALLRMDSTDVRGNRVNFNFYLPYDNESDYGVGETITVIGYPDTGGRTITYTSGLISGLLTEGDTRYIKTDADISFGNSGGTAVDDSGNFIGVPTYIVGSYSAEVLGYLYPVEEAVSWIDANKSKAVTKNEVADSQLRDAILANIRANETGRYINDYPPYEISVISGWKFGNSLEGAFDSGGYGSYSGSESLVIYPTDLSDTSQLYIEVSVTDYAYEVTLDDIEDILGSYAEDYYSDYYYDEEAVSSYERVDFNGQYPSVRETYSYYDWWYDQDINTVTYYIPYGDKVINVLYNYTTEDESRLGEVERILDTFKVDMNKIEMSIVNMVESEYPRIVVTNPLSDVYLSDDSYEYDGEYYFGASFGKKRDLSFSITIYSNYYWDDKYKGNFDLFKKDSLADAEEWYEVISSGDLKIDSHKGFYYTDEYAGYGETTYYTTIYIDNDDETYFTIYYSADKASYRENLNDFKVILNNIKLDMNGLGQYLIPNFLGEFSAVGALSDIENYVYEGSIKSLNEEGAFGDTDITKFDPAGALSRKDFVVWAVRTLNGDVATEFEDYESSYSGCSQDCFVDFDYGSGDGVYVDFAKSKGALGGLRSDGNYYFAPDAQITLVAALKIIFELYDYEIWQAPAYVPWYIPYLHLGYSEYVIPYGVNDIGYLLTRGEGAYVIDGVRSAFYYDDYWY